MMRHDENHARRSMRRLSLSFRAPSSQLIWRPQNYAIWSAAWRRYLECDKARLASMSTLGASMAGWSAHAPQLHGISEDAFTDCVRPQSAIRDMGRGAVGEETSCTIPPFRSTQYCKGHRPSRHAPHCRPAMQRQTEAHHGAASGLAVGEVDGVGAVDAVDRRSDVVERLGESVEQPSAGLSGAGSSCFSADNFEPLGIQPRKGPMLESLTPLRASSSGLREMIDSAGQAELHEAARMWSTLLILGCCIGTDRGVPIACCRCCCCWCCCCWCCWC
mmetsp:Transcript_7621/g.23781  ORF Transcript_7621/g.23781 Transcript_7621/m.23781 type:complete len:275 (+) Transcript_7621:296-1120(+)